MGNLTLIIGSNGQLGSELARTCLNRGTPYFGITHDKADITNYWQIDEIIRRFNPWLVINTAAYHKVDACEENQSQAFSVNAAGARNLAEICGDRGAILVHVSTDYVFDGLKGEPYVEEDAPTPINVYGVSKASGETLVRNILPQHFIVRTAAIQGLSKSSVKGSNFIETMLKLEREKGLVKVVSDQVTSPTYAPDLAAGILKLAETHKFGTYHLTNQGSCSWYDFAKEIFSFEGMDVEVVPISTDEAYKLFNSRARRPSNTSLNISKAIAAGITMRPWQNAIAAYLNQRRANAISN